MLAARLVLRRYNHLSMGEHIMKLLHSVLVIAFTTVSFCAVAADAASAPTSTTGKSEATAPKKLTPQQQKMKTCNHDAKEKALKGVERKAFMKSCLKKKKDVTAPAPL